MTDKIMSFDQFSKSDILEDPKTALTGNNVDPGKKEKFVDQVKKADLTQLETNEPDYAKVNEADSNEIANLQSVVTAAERELNDFKEKFYTDLAAKEKDLQSKREALNQAIATAASTTQTPTVAPTAQSATTPTAQQSIGGVTPGQAPAAPATA